MKTNKKLSDTDIVRDRFYKFIRDIDKLVGITDHAKEQSIKRKIVIDINDIKEGLRNRSFYRDEEYLGSYRIINKGKTYIVGTDLSLITIFWHEREKFINIKNQRLKKMTKKEVLDIFTSLECK